MTHADPVTPEMRAIILDLDDYTCVAPRLGAQMPCRSRFGAIARPGEFLELDHVPDLGTTKKGMSVAGPRRGQRAPSDRDHLVTLCGGHHESWATGHRDELREYIARRNRERSSHAT